MNHHIDLDDVLRTGVREDLAGPDTHGDPWHNPDQSYLGTGRRAPPKFPLSALGSFWADHAERSAESVSAPVDYAASALLASAGALLANVRWPVAGAVWSEPPVLWIGLVGSPSSGKSPAMEMGLSPVRRIEDQLAACFDEDLRLYELKREEAEAKRAAWREEVKAAVKGDSTPPSLPDGAGIPEAPVRPRVRVADATVEKLAALAAALPRGLLMVRDELSGWFGAFDRYGGGNGSDRAFALEMYGGRSYVVDRMKSPEPLVIRHLSIGVLGGIQPDRLSAVLSGPDDGLAPRFLWCWPEAPPTFRLARDVLNDAPVQDAFDRLSRLAMGSDAFGNPEPVALRLTAAAEDAIEQFGQEMADRANDASGAFAGALGKARGHALRLATILEFLWWAGEYAGAEPTHISEPAVRGACSLLSGYFVPMAERVYGDAAIPEQERHALVLVKHLRQRRASSFNARQLRREVGGDLRKPAAMEAACAVLVEAGLIRKIKRLGQGRPPGEYALNPVVIGANDA